MQVVIDFVITVKPSNTFQFQIFSTPPNSGQKTDKWNDLLCNLSEKTFRK